MQNDIGRISGHEFDAFSTVREWVVKGASAAGAAPDRSLKWGDWHEELFADVFSVLMMGPWALWALSELLMGSLEEMTAEHEEYPSPLLRLGVMRRAVDVLGMGIGGSLRGIDPGAFAAISWEERVIEKVVDALLRTALPCKTGQSLAELCAGARLGGGPLSATYAWPAEEVAQWREGFLERTQVVARQEGRSARLAACGLLAGWEIASGLDAPGRMAAKAAMARSGAAVIGACAPEGQRDAAETDGSGENGAALAREILDLVGSAARRRGSRE